MRALVRVVVALLLGAHGLVHLLGVVSGFGIADGALREPVATAGGVFWAAAALLVLATAAGLLLRTSWWWLVGAAALVVSQVAVVSAWSEAWAGTVPNVVLLLAVLYGWAAQGPGSQRAAFRSAVAEAQSASTEPRPLVTEADLAPLPPLVAAWMRASGAVGLPRVSGVRAIMSGRIRNDTGDPWMDFRAQQVSIYRGDVRRTFFLDATRKGMPVDVLHRYAGGSATMQVKPLSLFTASTASGPELDRAETVTVLNDLCLLSPPALLDLPVAFEALAEPSFRVTFTNGPHTVTAVVVLDPQHRLVDFVSDDRGRLSADGTSVTLQRWSTPLSEHAVLHGRLIPVVGRADWLTPAGPVTYAEMTIEECFCLPYDADVSEPGGAPPAARMRRKGRARGGDPDGTRTRDLRRDRAAR